MISTPRQNWAPWALSATAVLLVLADVAGWHGQPRVVLAALMFCLVPGLAVLRNLGLGIWLELTGAICLSVSTATLGASLMVYAGIWNPLGLLVLLAAVTVAGAAREILGGHKPA